jgi:hypothetical protein
MVDGGDNDVDDECVSLFSVGVAADACLALVCVCVCGGEKESEHRLVLVCVCVCINAWRGGVRDKSKVNEHTCMMVCVSRVPERAVTPPSWSVRCHV